MMKKSAIRLYVCAGLALVLVAAPARAQYRPRPVSTPSTGESYHIEFGVGLWVPTADITHLERIARHPRLDDRLQERPRPDQPAVPRVPARAAPDEEEQAARAVHPDQVRPDGDAHARHRLQRPAVFRRPPRHLDARLEGAPLRLRVRLHLARPRLRRRAPRREVHGRPGHARQRIARRVHARQSADPRHRRHLPLLRRMRTSR